jgi:AhpD family alkylhydroperoxidase
MSGQRLQYAKVAPAAVKALSDVEKYVKTSGLEESLVELVKMRASQINHCAYCLNMHSADARKNGETEQRLYVLDAWEETQLFTPRERAALAWTESLTRLPETGAPDKDYAPLAEHFSEKEIVDLTVLIGMINLWNRIGVGFRLALPMAKP